MPLQAHGVFSNMAFVNSVRCNAYQRAYNTMYLYFTQCANGNKKMTVDNFKLEKIGLYGVYALIDQILLEF